MQTLLKDRLDEALGKRTQTELAEACHVTTGAVSQWMDGTTKTLKAATAHRAATFLGVNFIWLTEGRGSMRPGSSDNPAPTFTPPLTLPDLLETVRDKMGELPEADREAMAGLVSGYINAKSENTREAMMAGIKRLCQVEQHNGGAPPAQKSKVA